MSFSQLSRTISIFFSYAIEARKDKNLFDELKKHLIAVGLQRPVAEWYDSAVSAGNNRRQLVDAQISKSDIIVLLLSVEFLASDDCRDVEMKLAFEQSKAGAARVISVLLSPTDRADLPFNLSILLPSDGKPVTNHRPQATALVEVAKGIRKVVEEAATQVVDTFARSKRQRFHWNVPHRRNPFFTGREDVLAKLHDYFTSSQTSYTSVQALSGLGGIGKTQIAVEYAYRYQNEYQAVLWINADPPDLFRADVDKLADLLSLSDKGRKNEQDLFTAIRQWLQEHDNWLLLLDYLEDFDLFDRLVPPRCSGHVLLTTRTQATGALAHAFAIPQMTYKEGTLLLLRRAKLIPEGTTKEAASATDYAQATLMAQAVDGFPLALDQAGAYIEETQKSLPEYLALYKRQRSRLLKRRGRFSNGHPQSVATTFALAFHKIAQNSAVDIELLRLFAFLHPDAIPEEMIAQGSVLNEPLQSLTADPLALDAAIANLLSYSLVHRHADTTTLSIHRIVQELLKDELASEQQRQWAISVVLLVNSVFPHVDFSTWSLCQRYLPQAQKCAEYIIELDLMTPEAASLLFRLGSYCYERALYAEAESYLTQALAIREQVLESDDPEIARSLNALSLLYIQQGRYHEAEILEERALAIYERTLGPDHCETAIALNNRALIYRKQGKHSLAEPRYQRALNIYEKTLESNNPEIATTLNNLALVYQEQGKYALAETLYQRALTIHEAVLPPEHPGISQSLNNLATLYQEQGKYAQAEPLLLRSLAICEQALGSEHPDTAQSLNNLANFYGMEEEYVQAELLYQRAFAICEKTLGSKHPDLADTLNNLAFLYRKQGKYQLVEPLYLQALAIYEYALGSEHSDTALILNNLGKFYLIQGNDQKAEPLLKRAATIYEQVSGPEHPDTAMSLSNLAELYAIQTKYEQAELLYKRALEIYEKTLGAGHLNIATTLEKCASLLEQTQRAEEATTLRLSASAIRDNHTSRYKGLVP